MPKRGVRQVQILWEGLEEDRQRDRRYHGGPDRAVTLYSLDLIRALQGEGHPIAPGSIGENLTIEGLDWEVLSSGTRLETGQATLELTRPASPCVKIAGSFLYGDYGRVSDKAHPGWSRWCARVVREGLARVGDEVRVTPG